MKGFAKDILLFDFESTGLDLDYDEPIQLAAVLLDREDLTEKESFTSLIKPVKARSNAEASKVHGITDSMLKDAPGLAEVAQSFLTKFSNTDIFLASWNTVFDSTMMRKLLKSVGKDIFIFDYHYLDVWPICYMYLCRKGEGDKIRGNATFNALGLPPRGNHDALEDCRYTAEALRAVYEGKEY